MGLIADLLDAPGVATAVEAADAGKLAAQLSAVAGIEIIPQSVVGNEGAIYAMGRTDGERMLFVCARTDEAPMGVFEGESRSADVDGEGLRMLLCEANHANAVRLREQLLHLRPQCIGLSKSFGFGDRLGLATPGHVLAVRRTSMRPFFAQQSIREMTRSGRSPETVMDDATWGMMETGYREPHGADADHLKNTDDVDVCLAAGFTLFTIDPGAHVDDAADAASATALREKFDALPWDALETTPADCRSAFVTRPVRISDEVSITFTEETLVRAAVKYGRAALHTAKLYRHLAGKAPETGFELEVSVDETETPTSVAEHYYIASELKRLGVKWVSLAPRFVGAFEKGVDYIGDIGEFDRTFACHVEIARHLGPYKLSLHSGSDKFSIYPVAAKHAGDLIHVKTAGTSYLEALRVIADLDAELFREIFAFAVGRYEEDKKTYHVSAQLSKAPDPSALAADELPNVLDQFDARQVLHVSYGSVLMSETADGTPRFRDRLLTTLKAHPEAYAATLERHLGRHVQPFA